MTNQIELIQVPVIRHLLAEAGKKVSERISALNLENQVATEDTVKALKNLRAELNKELTDYEGQRKAIKEGILNPYNEFEGIYKSEIAEKYTAAISLLKDKIATVENQIKTEKKVKLERFFAEICAVEKIDFVRFNDAVPEINLSTSEKAYKEQINAFITKVIDDLNLINSEEFQAEILTEYKRTLSASAAITTVRARKEAEKREAERIRAAEIERRKGIVKRLGLVYVDITDSWEYDADIFISMEFLEYCTKEAFQAAIAKIEAQIAEKKKAAQAATDEATGENPTPVTPAAPVSAPTVVTDEPILTASFEVKGTRAQLLALGQYMKTNGITYKNI